jgi:DNA primase
MAREQSKNELQVIAGVKLIEYYNTQILPLNKKYHAISEERNTGLCPFHADNDPSLHYWKSKNIFHCFGCGFGGDVVKTHMKLRKIYYNESLSIEKAIQHLASLFSISLDIETGFTIKSVFDQARELLLSKETYSLSDQDMSLAEFRKLNSRVKNSNYNLGVKISNFDNLDLLASVALSKK